MFNRILNYFRMLGRDPNIIMLGRWNGKNSSKYLEWGNMDNCYIEYKNK